MKGLDANILLHLLMAHDLHRKAAEPAAFEFVPFA